MVNGIPESLKARPIPAWGFDVHPAREVLGVNVTRVIELLFPNYYDMSKWHLRDFEADRAAIQAWCDANGAVYYARGREEFSMSEAREEALAAGKSLVVYEDLS